MRLCAASSPTAGRHDRTSLNGRTSKRCLLLRWERGKRPVARQNLRAWAVEADQVVPTVRDRKGVLSLATKTHGDGVIRIARGGDVVDAVGALLVGFEEALG